jgi:hypothetical protein
MFAVIVTIGLFIIVYAVFVRPRIRVYRYVAGVQDKIDSGAVKGLALLWEKLMGFKTVILSGLAGVSPMLPPLLDELHAFTGWAAFVEQATANKIAAGFALLAMIAHATGIESAAKATPKE